MSENEHEDAFMDACRVAAEEAGGSFDGYTIWLPEEPLTVWAPSDRLTREQIETGLLLEHRAMTAPWKVARLEDFGDDWTIATMGDDDEGSWIVTTDRVRASESNGGTAKGDGEFIAWSRNHVGRMLRELERLYALEMGGKLAPQE